MWKMVFISHNDYENFSYVFSFWSTSAGWRTFYFDANSFNFADGHKTKYFEKNINLQHFFLTTQIHVIRDKSPNHIGESNDSTADEKKMRSAGCKNILDILTF